MRQRRSIIVGVDGSSESTDAALVAASLARSLGRRLVLAHVAADPNVFAYGDRAQRDAKRTQALEAGRDLLEAVADVIDEPAEKRVVIGPLGKDRLADNLAMLQRQEEADLLVVGSRPRHPLVRALLGGPAGSPTAWLASLSACPVLVVPRGAGARFEEHQAQTGSVICGVDGSPGSDRALAVASDLASGLGPQRSSGLRDALARDRRGRWGFPGHRWRSRGRSQRSRLLEPIADDRRGHAGFRGSSALGFTPPGREGVGAGADRPARYSPAALCA